MTLVRGKKLLAEVRPLPAGAHLSALPGLLASPPRLSAAEAGEFAADLEASSDELGEAHENAGLQRLVPVHWDRRHQRSGGQGLCSPLPALLAQDGRHCL